MFIILSFNSEFGWKKGILNIGLYIQGVKTTAISDYWCLFILIIGILITNLATFQAHFRPMFYETK